MANTAAATSSSQSAEHFSRHRRREVQPERGRDQDLSDLAPAARRGDAAAGELERRHGDERTGHPRQRRMQQKADCAADRARRERGERGPSTF